LLLVKYVTDKAKSDPNSLIEVPNGGSFDDMLALRGDKEIGDRINKIISELAEANDLQKVIDLADFNDEEKLGKGKEMQDRLSSWLPSSMTWTSAAAVPRATTCSATPMST
jgi:type I restriction enzyme M protein